MKKLALLLCLIMLCALCSCIATAAPSETLSGEPSAEPSPPEAMGDGIDADAAWEWLLAELEETEDTAKLVQTKTVGGCCVILADLLKPATEDVYLAEVFLLESSDDAFTIAAHESVDPPVSAGFTADLLHADDITVVFGDLSDSFYEFWHDERVYTNYTEARIMFTDGTEHTAAVSNDTPYMAIVDGTREVSDIEFVTDARSILRSEFYDHPVGDDNPYDDE